MLGLPMLDFSRHDVFCRFRSSSPSQVHLLDLQHEPSSSNRALDRARTMVAKTVPSIMTIEISELRAALFIMFSFGFALGFAFVRIFLL